MIIKKDKNNIKKYLKNKKKIKMQKKFKNNYMTLHSNFNFNSRFSTLIHIIFY